jgi:hypothetical protein
MIEIKAPDKVYHWTTKPRIFLAGSIEMGKADNWQTRLVNDLHELDIVCLNPRRDRWDPSWDQTISNPDFYEQVDWEHNGIKNAHIVLFYFDPNTKSPITLMELGLVAALEKRAIVCCPDGFWRKGNVEYICHKYNIPLKTSYEEMLPLLKSTITLLPEYE